MRNWAISHAAGESIVGTICLKDTMALNIKTFIGFYILDPTVIYWGSYPNSPQMLAKVYL